MTRGAKHYLWGLGALKELQAEPDRRAAFRQGMAALAEAALASRGVPLEGLNPDALLQSVRIALQARWLEDLGFLSPPGAACALYGLASALPHGPERRELGRLVLTKLHEGDAATFVALSTVVALGSTRAFAGPAMGVRVALSLQLPPSAGARADSMALALISRRDLAQRWVVEPSTGALPGRLMAARLLERAAREAARRAAQGDDGGVWLLESPGVQAAWQHLLADREPLVWQQVATARGLLSGSVPRHAEELERDLGAHRSSSRGRRAATSLAARLAVQPKEVLSRARDLLLDPSAERDPSFAAAMVYGLSRAGELEPTAAEELLSLAVEHGGPLAAEALRELRSEWVGGTLGQTAARLVCARLQTPPGGTRDDGHDAWLEMLREELEGPARERATSLPRLVSQALRAFSHVGALAAHDLACRALVEAERLVVRLEQIDEDEGPAARHEIFRCLDDLDRGLFESSALQNLLSLGPGSHDPPRQLAPLCELLARLQRVLLARESIPHGDGEEVPHLALRMHRLRVLTHVFDADLPEPEELAHERGEERRDAVCLLLQRVRMDGPSAMDRAVHMALARGCDSLVRREILELSDVVLSAAAYIPTPEGFVALYEGSTLPEVKPCLKALSSLVRALFRASHDLAGQRAVIECVFDLSRSLPAESSPRTEGLRASLLRLGRALLHVSMARSLRELCRDRTMEFLESGLDDLVRLSAGAFRRMGVSRSEGGPTSGHGVWALGIAIERAALDDMRSGLELTIEALADSVRAELPPIFASVVLRVVAPLLERPSEASMLPLHKSSLFMDHRPLPAWLPPARRLGGFFVQRALRSGPGSSVFVAKPAARAADPETASLALKVPEYGGGAARVLSEVEFIDLFRREATALLEVPRHPNLARVLVVDARSTPKPFLVMDLIEGPTLERVLAKGAMEVPRALALLDGVLSGLDAMHAAGVGHLDLTPSNVILQELHGVHPVLVDFGLSGRCIRPGCGAGPYGAPEIWAPGRAESPPMAADVYAFGCLAFELLTGRVLFEASSDAAMVAAHLDHDGQPPALIPMLEDGRLSALGKWLSQCLRRDPAARASARQLREGLAGLEELLRNQPWPLSAPVEPSF